MPETFNAGTVAAYAKLDISGIVKGVAGAKASLQLYGDQAVAIITKSNSSMHAAMQQASTGMLAGGAAIAGGLMLATKTAAAFDQAMRNVNSIAKLNASEFDTLRGSVSALTNDPGIKDGPAALAKGLYDVYSSGFKGKEAIDVLTIAAKGASAGMTDTATSGRALMAVLNSGIGGVHSAREGMDLLFKTVDLGVVNFEQLSSSIGQVLPTAKAAGLTLQDVGAAIAVMTRQGQSGSEATNDLLNVITKIKNPSEEAKKAFAAAGLAYGQSAFEGKNLAQVMSEIITKTRGNQDALQALFPDMQAFRGVLSLSADAGGQLKSMYGDMATAGVGLGAMQMALNEQMQGAEFQFAKASQALEGLGIAIGESVLPMVRPLISEAADLVREFGRLDQPTRDATVRYVTFGAVAMTAAVAVGMLVGALKNLAPLLPLLKGIKLPTGAEREWIESVNAWAKRGFKGSPLPGAEAGVDFNTPISGRDLNSPDASNMRSVAAAFKGGWSTSPSDSTPDSSYNAKPWGDGIGGGGGGGRSTRTGAGAAQAAGGRLGGIYMDLYNQMQAWRAERLASMQALDDEWYDSVSGMFDDAIRHQQAADAEVASIAASWRDTLDLMGGGIAEAFGIMGAGMASLNARQIGAQSFGIGAGFGSSLNSTITTLDTQQTGEALGRGMMDQAQAIVGIADIVTRQMAEAHKRVLGTIGEIATSLTDTAWTTIHDATRQVFGDGRLAKGFAEGLSGMLQSSLATALENIDTWLSKTFGGTLGGILGIGVKLWAGGAFADGGTAPAGRWSLVGERGPEWIKPQSPTTVLPHGRAPGQVGQTSIQITMTGPVTMGSEADVNLLGDRLGWHVRQQLRASF